MDFEQYLQTKDWETVLRERAITVATLRGNELLFEQQRLLSTILPRDEHWVVDPQPGYDSKFNGIKVEEKSRSHLIIRWRDASNKIMRGFGPVKHPKISGAYQIGVIERFRTDAAGKGSERNITEAKWVVLLTKTTVYLIDTSKLRNIGANYDVVVEFNLKDAIVIFQVPENSIKSIQLDFKQDYDEFYSRLRTKISRAREIAYG